LALASLAPQLAAARELSPMQVVVVKRAGVTAYEEVAEEFDERCRVRARVVSFGDEGLAAGRFDADELVVVTVGQEALDAMKGTRARLIPTLAFHTAPQLIGPPASPSPELILRALALTRPQKVRIVGAVYGPRSEALMKEAIKAAERLGITLIASRVSDGPSAVRALHQLAKQVHALWLPGDPDVLTPQVFQYALLLQLEHGLPLAAATRQQVHSGALVAADFSPRAAGRIAADLANRYLDGLDASSAPLELYNGVRLTVNATVAHRLGADVAALQRMGARLE
jgi:hypothetical protein